MSIVAIRRPDIWFTHLKFPVCYIRSKNRCTNQRYHRYYSQIEYLSEPTSKITFQWTTETNYQSFLRDIFLSTQPSHKVERLKTRAREFWIFFLHIFYLTNFISLDFSDVLRHVIAVFVEYFISRKRRHVVNKYQLKAFRFSFLETFSN